MGGCSVHRSAEARENLGLMVDCQVALKPGQRQKLEAGSEAALAEQVKASVRAKSLPPTTIGGGISLLDGEAEVRLHQGPAPSQNGVRYRGLAKNTNLLALLLGAGQFDAGPALPGRLTLGPLEANVALTPKTALERGNNRPNQGLTEAANLPGSLTISKVSHLIVVQRFPGTST